tara:strand:+ start:184 stop:954 length:771 start_codon:yes stop_codon:yes gene_type:complete
MNIESIIKNFDDLKKNWERVDEDIGWQNSVASHIGKQRLEEIIKLRDYLESQDSNLLDLGCDNGLYTFILKDKFKKLIGLDNSPNAIEKTFQTNLWYQRHFSKHSRQNNLNIDFILGDFEKYAINRRYNIHQRTFSKKIWSGDEDLVEDSVFLDDDIQCVLACEILHLFDDNLVNLFKQCLRTINMVMVQPKFIKRNQWEIDESEYSKSDATKIKKWNSHDLYCRDGVVDFLNNNGFTKIEFVSPESNCGVVIGKK